MAAGVVYALVDPRTSEIRYVGKTRQTVQRRYQFHRNAAAAGGRTYRVAWLRKLYSLGLEPQLFVLEEAADLDEAECRWIAEMRWVYRERLTNATDGGDGGCSSPRGCFSAEWHTQHPEWVQKNRAGGRNGGRRKGDGGRYAPGHPTRLAEAQARRTPEERSAQAKRAWETRRRKKLEQNGVQVPQGGVK